MGKGQLSVGEARKAAFGAHDAARNVKNRSASAAARATGHAVATAHMADHCLKAATYALKAVQEAGRSAEAERTWQIERLPDNVRELVLSALGLSVHRVSVQQNSENQTKEHTMKSNTYLYFNGQCAAAFKFYEQCLGGKITSMMTYGDSPMAEQASSESRGQIMHVALTVGDVVLMGSDEIGRAHV